MTLNKLGTPVEEYLERVQNASTPNEYFKFLEKQGNISMMTAFSRLKKEFPGAGEAQLETQVEDFYALSPEQYKKKFGREHANGMV